MKRLSLASNVLGLGLCLVGCIASPGGSAKKDLGGDGFIDFIDMARNTTSCVGGGTVCSSSNPGKCDPGIVTCSGKLAMCTPNSTVQDCYTGPPGTQGVGICASGQQSCIGIVDPNCNGQITPAAKEDCTNDADDDCDGKVNNTCPQTLQIGSPRYLTPLAPTPPPANANQTSIEKRCPANSFVTRMQIEFDDPNFQVSGISFTCGTPVLTMASGGTYTLASTPVAPAPYDNFMGSAAVSTGTPYDVNCLGLGLRGVVSIKGDYDAGGYIGLFGHCGVATATINPDNTLKITVAATGADIGYDYGTLVGAGTKPSWTCANNEVIVGWKGVVSRSIDQLQPVCAALTPQYKL